MGGGALHGRTQRFAPTKNRVVLKAESAALSMVSDRSGNQTDHQRRTPAKPEVSKPCEAARESVKASDFIGNDSKDPVQQGCGARSETTTAPTKPARDDQREKQSERVDNSAKLIL